MLQWCVLICIISHLKRDVLEAVGRGWWGVDGKGRGWEVGGCTKCPLCSPRIGKMPCRAWFVHVCVCVSVYLCVCVGATPVRRAWGKQWDHYNECVHVHIRVSVCEADIVKGISLRGTRALKTVGYINLLCPNCFPLLTWLVTMPFSLSQSLSKTHTWSHILPLTFSRTQQ